MTPESTPIKKVSATFPKANRILKSRDFAKLQKSSGRIYSKNFTVILAKNKAGRESANKADSNNRHAVRLGITVSKKTEASAVKRNRIKRVIREAFRSIKEICIPGLSVIVIAKNSCINSGSRQVKNELLALLRVNKCLTDR